MLRNEIQSNNKQARNTNHNKQVRMFEGKVIFMMQKTSGLDRMHPKEISTRNHKVVAGSEKQT